MSSERAVAGSLILALIAAFVVLASGVLSAATETIDDAILQALRTSVSDPIGPPGLERAVLNLSALDSVAVTTLLVVIASLFLLLDHRPRQAALVIGVAVIAAIGLAVIKSAVGR